MTGRIPVYLTRSQIDALLFAVVAQQGQWEDLNAEEWGRELAARERALKNADAALRAAVKPSGAGR